MQILYTLLFNYVKVFCRFFVQNLQFFIHTIEDFTYIPTFLAERTVKCGNTGFYLSGVRLIFTRL